MLSRRAEIMALCALMLAVASFVMTLQPHWPVIAAGPTGPDNPEAISAIPSSLNYQGTLRLANGALANGTYNMTFRIYSVAAGGSALHTETINGVVVRDGGFNVVLGDTTAIPATVFADAPRFIGVQVGTDPEMVPRQRLHPVPWAQQATNAVNATTLLPNATVNGLTVNGTLGITGGRILAFGRDQGDEVSAGSMVYKPSYATDSLVVVGAGTGVPGRNIRLYDNVFTYNNLSVGGELTVKARRDVGGRAAPVQITTSTYDVSVRRYVVEAPDGSTTPNSVPIDDALLMQLCSDIDGCTFSLGMRNFATSVTGPDALATIGPFRLSIGPTVSGKRYWDLRFVDGNSIAGEDGNSAVNHVAKAWGCYFTDGKYLSAQGTDTTLGFELLNWFGEYDATEMMCVLIIED